MRKKIINQTTRAMGEITTLYEPDIILKEMELEITTKKYLKRVTFRNVGNANPGAAIQFTIEEYNKATNRTRYISFSVPLCMAEAFIEHLKTVQP